MLIADDNAEYLTVIAEQLAKCDTEAEMLKLAVKNAAGECLKVLQKTDYKKYFNKETLEAAIAQESTEITQFVIE